MALKAQVRLDNECDAGRFDLRCERIKVFRAEAGTEVRHWNFIAVDRVEVVSATVLLTDPVAYELVTKHVIVLPLRRAAALLEAENAAVERLRLLEVVHWDRQVEWLARFVLLRRFHGKSS